MEKKTATSFFMIILNLISAYVKRFADISRLTVLEAKLAGITLIKITILIYIMSLLLFSTWLCILLVLFMYLISLHYSWLFASSLITIVNFVLLILVTFFVLKLKRNLLFEATRRQLAAIKDNHE